MVNEDIKMYAKNKNVYLWQVADRLGISEATINRMLRKKISVENRLSILNTIDAISIMKIMNNK